ncbi:tetratricopeptide repeat protein [Streptomyces hainanensis]|uniref:tetratricopeptide repeat protein n=1 Tax=Streptomyces hainanensis TaxID=402648 RepID=UPI001FB627B3|nr:tetratricopeptide repeat protein [Streptomyces hainanensis]
MASEVSLEDAAVRELLALSGRGLPLLREWASEDPRSGVARALLMLATGDGLSDEALKQELVVAYQDARAVGPRQASLVHGVFLHTHRHYRLTADHLVRHFAQWPTDEVAGLMLGAFHDCGDPAYREHGDALVEKQYALAGPDNWAWAGWLASARAEQGRVDEAHELAERALARHPRSGVAAHARAHAEHELGAGPAAVAFLDRWLATDPGAMNFGHLNWHAALQSIACGDFPDARRRADTALAHSDVGMRAATNWRLLLIGQSPAGRCDPGLVRELLAAPGGMAEVFHTFNLALALAVEAATDDLHVLAGRAAADDRPDYRDVLAPVAEALAHLTGGRPRAAVDLLAGLGERVERLGGVRVEREIVQDTLARALADIGEHARAADLLHHRVTTRRHHTYEDLLLTGGENAGGAQLVQQGRAPRADPHASSAGSR